MISAMQSALSALSAYSTKINSNSNNIANASTEGFKKSRVILSSAEPQGVTAQTERVDTPGAMIYEQTSNGMELVEQSNVDIGEELPAMSLNAHLYKANLKTLQVADEMLGSLLKTKA
ncbi:MAG: flagellar basal body rod C-terminal domain-containing protein [Pseudomonadota bacterium]